MMLFESRITVLQEPGMSDEEWDDQEEGFTEIGDMINGALVELEEKLRISLDSMGVTGYTIEIN